MSPTSPKLRASCSNPVHYLFCSTYDQSAILYLYSRRACFLSHLLPSSLLSSLNLFLFSLLLCRIYCLASLTFLLLFPTFLLSFSFVCPSLTCFHSLPSLLLLFLVLTPLSYLLPYFLYFPSSCLFLLSFLFVYLPFFLSPICFPPLPISFLSSFSFLLHCCSYFLASFALISVFIFSYCLSPSYTFHFPFPFNFVSPPLGPYPHSPPSAAPATPVTHPRPLVPACECSRRPGQACVNSASSPAVDPLQGD